MPRVLFVATDAGASRALKAVSGTMSDVRTFLLDAGKLPKPSDEELRLAVSWADIVVSGMSSENSAAFELQALAFAVELDKQIVFFSDTWKAWARQWFADYRDHAAIVTIVVASEKKLAEQLFPNSVVVATGNPAWEEFHQSGDRAQAREVMGVTQHERVIFISGTKSLEVNQEMITLAVATVSGLNVSYRVVFSVHPGDNTNLTLYEIDPCVVILTQNQMPGDQAVYGADVVLAYNAASIAMRAVANTIPVIALRTPRAVERLASESDGSTNHPLVPHAALDGGSDQTKLAFALGELYMNPRLLAEGQIQFFPPIESGAYTRALGEAILAD